MKLFIICNDCNYKVYLDSDELFYSKYMLCLCGNLVLNPNFDEVKLNKHLEHERSR